MSTQEYTVPDLQFNDAEIIVSFMDGDFSTSFGLLENLLKLKIDG
jgi:hypothetical protein